MKSSESTLPCLLLLCGTERERERGGEEGATERKESERESANHMHTSNHLYNVHVLL